MRPPFELLLVIIRLLLAGVVFSMCLLGGITYWKSRFNPVLRFGGALLMFRALKDMIAAILFVYWSLITTHPATSRGIAILSSIYLVSILEHIVAIILLMYLLGYLHWEVSPPKDNEVGAPLPPVIE